MDTGHRVKSDLRNESDTQVSDAIAGPTFSALCVTYVDGPFEDTTKVLDRKVQRRADLRFAIGVALALALPAVIGLGVYVAAESLILRARLKARLPVAVAPRRRNPQRWSPNNGLAFTGLYILQKAPHRLEQPNRDPCNKTAPTKRSYGTGGKINPASEVVFPFG